MIKEEAIALGVPEEKYREFQNAYNRDLNLRAQRIANSMYADSRDGEEWVTLSAIYAMLKMIKRHDTLESILRYINTAYYREG